MKDVSNAERLKLLEHSAHLPIYEHRDIVVRDERASAVYGKSLKQKKDLETIDQSGATGNQSGVA